MLADWKEKQVEVKANGDSSADSIAWQQSHNLVKTLLWLVIQNITE